jgi:ferredoxin-fold anticodon binding domain-containing protein
MPQAHAKTVTALEGVGFDTSASLKDTLKAHVGKDVVVHLRSGKTLQGYVKSVGDHFLHLEKLAGREFYDALVRIEDISAIEVKFRDLK